MRMGTKAFWAGVAVAAGMMGAMRTSVGATFTNNASIAIPTLGKASVFPSVISVPAAVTIQNISVVLNGVTHSRMADISILLVSPSGKKIQLMAGTEAGTLTNFAGLVFADSGRPITSGAFQKVTYRPTVIPSARAMAAPAPELPYEVSFGSLIGENGAGDWSLYIQDNFPVVGGSVSGGWSLNINSANAGSLVHSEFVYQGILKSGGAALTGGYDVRLDLWKSPTSVVPADKVGSATSFGVQVENGLFTTRFAPSESALTAGDALWAEISVREMGGSDFKALSPREPISATPLATYAILAGESEFATQAGTVGWDGVTGVPPNVENAFSPWAPGTSNGINNTNSGNVRIGTTTGNSRLTVNGTIESQVGGFRFPDDTVQTSAAIAPVGTTISINFSSIAAGAEAASNVNFALGSFLTTDVVVVNPTSDLPADCSISYARVVSATQIRFVIRNHGTVAVDPPILGFSFRVIR